MITEHEITDKEFKLFSSLVYNESGIRLNENKKALLVSRLSKRLRALGLNSFKQYYEKYLGNENQDELIQMLDLISTNKTGFFREPAHFDFLKTVILPSLSPLREIKIWSAACSSGEEPYTIAMTLYDHVLNPDQWDMSILASDLSTRVLAQAESGLYTLEQINVMNSLKVKRHFSYGAGQSEGKAKVKPHLQKMVTFRRINLMDKKYPIKNRFDLIFCRNVMIYFDRPTQESLMKKFVHYLKPGGYLFIGHSESLQWLDHSYQYVAPTIYRLKI